MKTKEAILVGLGAFFLIFGIIAFINVILPQDFGIDGNVFIRIPFFNWYAGLGLSSGIAFITFLRIRYNFLVDVDEPNSPDEKKDFGGIAYDGCVKENDCDFKTCDQ